MFKVVITTSGRGASAVRAVFTVLGFIAGVTAVVLLTPELWSSGKLPVGRREVGGLLLVAGVVGAWLFRLAWARIDRYLTNRFA